MREAQHAVAEEPAAKSPVSSPEKHAPSSPAPPPPPEVG